MHSQSHGLGRVQGARASLGDTEDSRGEDLQVVRLRARSAVLGWQLGAHILGSTAPTLELSRHSEVTVVIMQDEVGLKLDYY